MMIPPPDLTKREQEHRHTIIAEKGCGELHVEYCMQEDDTYIHT